MRKFISLTVVAALALSLASISAIAQQEMKKGPPKIIHITREEVKPGRAAAHEKLEAAWSQAIAKARPTSYWLTLTSVSGPNEMWFINPFASWKEWEDEGKAFSEASLQTVMMQYGPQETDFLSGQKSVIAVLQDKMSYKADFNIGDYRGFVVRTVRVKPGHEDDYRRLVAMVMESRAKNGLTTPSITYRARFGAPLGTYMSFRPYKSATQWEDEKDPIEMMADDQKKEFWSLVENAVISAEDSFYTFSGSLSHMPENVVAAAPDFWQPKAVTAGKTAKGSVKPASKKEE